MAGAAGGLVDESRPLIDEPRVSLRDRSPHPYSARPRSDDLDRYPEHRHPVSITGTSTRPSTSTSTGSTSRRSSFPNATASESGTEADDEKPHQLLRALPPPVHRPRKGLRGSLTPLLTATELDHEGVRLSRGRLDAVSTELRSHRAHLEDERIKFEERQRAERVRRLCEASLLALTGLVVAYGSGVWRVHGLWYLVLLLSQLASIAALVACYPLKLVSVELRRGHIHIWSRFSIPPSFDPANVLYPTFLPVLVAVSLSRQSAALVLPTLILGLSSLPDRLFPRWSHAALLNPLHWALSLVPLVVARLMGLSVRVFPVTLYHLRAPPLYNAMDPECLVSLFPLHRTLLASIHYFSVTSLLPAEKQLLSSSLIMLLFFAGSPQTVILRSILWTGGLGVYVLSIHLLRWNVALSRVPAWRLAPSRRASGSGRAFLTLGLSAVDILKQGLGAGVRNEPSGDSESDSPAASKGRRWPKHSVASPVSDGPRHEAPFDHLVSPQGATDSFSPQRRNTTFTPEPVKSSERANLHSPRRRRRRRDWRLQLDANEMAVRKYVYSALWFVAVLSIIISPVRRAVAEQALAGAEPITWIWQYMFGDLPWHMLSPGRLDNLALANPRDLKIMFQDLVDRYQSVPDLRVAVGPGNVRLLFVTHCVLVLALGLSAQALLAARIEIDTRRKIFHGVIVAMLLPTIAIDPCLVSLALTISLGIISILELIRAGQVWPLGPLLSTFLAPYVDGRDLRGPIVISHFFLLIGCAIPLWLSLGTLPRAGTGVDPDWELEGAAREVSMVSGVVCVGMGDAAASLIGRRYGRRKWPWIGGKSLEGSAAFAVAVALGLVASKIWLRAGGWRDVPSPESDFSVRGPAGRETRWVTVCVKALLAAFGASFMEAVLTGANDNVVVPIALWLLVRGLHL